jgi:hypothetical protein
MIVTKKAGKAKQKASHMYQHKSSQPTGIYFIQGRPSSIGSDNHLEKEKEKDRNAMHDDFCACF